jgi:large subunit ribosomal protein L10
VLRSEKQEFVAALEGVYKESKSVIVTHYHGLTVSQITSLRTALREKGAKFKVVKNTLSSIAARNSGLATSVDMFSGPTAVAYSTDAVAAAKVVVDFAKTNKNLKIICGVIDNQLIDAASVEQVAKLPSLEELRAQIIGILQAPATKIAGVLQAPAAGLARLLSAYATKK